MGGFFKSLLNSNPFTAAVSSTIGGAFGLIQNNQTNKAAAREAQKNRDWQEQMINNQNQFSQQQMQLQHDLNMQGWQEQFNATNAYNDPAAQKQRLLDAGLNAQAILGGGATSGASAATPSQTTAPSGLGSAPPGAQAPVRSAADDVLQFSAAAKNLAEAISTHKKNKYVDKEMQENLALLAAKTGEAVQNTATGAAEESNIQQDTRLKEVMTDIQSAMYAIEYGGETFEFKRSTAANRAIMENYLSIPDKEIAMKFAEKIQASDGKLDEASEAMLSAYMSKIKQATAEYNKTVKEAERVDNEKANAAAQIILGYYVANTQAATARYTANKAYEAAVTVASINAKVQKLLSDKSVESYLVRIFEDFLPPHEAANLLRALKDNVFGSGDDDKPPLGVQVHSMIHNQQTYNRYRRYRRYRGK